MCSKTAPSIFIFSIVLGAEYSSYLKSIEAHARAFFKVIIFSIGTVNRQIIFFCKKIPSAETGTGFPNTIVNKNQGSGKLERWKNTEFISDCRFI